jgi:alkylation response protein AidB-like acyl-CoA dehydrogenase
MTIHTHSAQTTAPRDDRRAADLLATAARLAADFSETAAARDRAGGTPKRERDLLRASGLLALSIPIELGGAGGSWTEVMRAVRIVATADPSIAHVFGFQHLLLATVRLFGGDAAYARAARETATRSLFWGNALNPLDERLRLVREGEGRVLRGDKSFCSGARDSDVLVVSARDDADKLVVAVLPTTRQGITTHEDWDAMGQRQTDSGTVSFDGTSVAADEILTTPGPLGSVFASLRPCIAQLSLANVYLGIAEGALGAAKAETLGRRGWHASGVARAVDDPYVLATYGDLWAEIEAARHLTEHAAQTLDAAWSRADDLTPEERGTAAIAIAAAKIVTTRVGLDVTTRMFDGAGARAAAGRAGLDRFWRNVRTHTLHDPVDYKRRDVGRWFLTGEPPKPSFYA